MSLSFDIAQSFAGGWDVLKLFLIPIGGGIPAGVVMAQSRGIEWPVMMALYFVSDVILACVFDPLMWLIVEISRRSKFMARVHAAAKQNTKVTISKFGTHLGPLTLIMISFGVDPMTGRAATAAVGHGFITGWMLAITGDMIYFSVIMVSTLWLNHILGDGTWTTIIILILMMGIPALIRKFREFKAKSQN
jgi:hypothetical protein